MAKAQAMKPKTSKGRCVFRCCLIIMLLGLGLHLLYLWQYRRQETFLENAVPMTMLHSQEQYQKVRVPFQRSQGWVVVQADFSGRLTNCILDTGTPYIIWPASLRLSGNHTLVHYSEFAAYFTAYPGPAEWRILPSIRLGNYELHDCPTLAYGSEKSPIADFQKTDIGVAMNHAPILGYPAYARTVLTIDFQKQELIFRQPAYDITHLPSHSGAYLLDMVKSETYPNVPVVLGTVAGHPVHIVLDTGSAVIGIGLTDEKLISAIKQQTGRNVIYNDRLGTEVVPDAVWSVGDLIDQSPIDLVPKLTSGDVDAVLGYELLRNYRITIDFTRRKILLEWNPLHDMQASHDVQFRVQARREGVRSSPNFWYAHVGLGKALFEAGRYKDAQEEFAVGETLNPGDAMPHFRRGQSFYFLHQYSFAGGEFRKAVQLSPNEAYYKVWLGKSLYSQGHQTAARSEWQKALVIDKAGAVARQAKALIDQFPVKALR